MNTEEVKSSQKELRVRLPRDLHCEVKIIAAASDRSLTDVAVEAIRRYVQAA